MKLTRPQRTWVVERSDGKGRMSCPGANGFVKASWRKAMENLRKFDLARPNAHGEYELTPKGEAYKEGALAAEIAWSTWPLNDNRLRAKLDEVVSRVSDVIGPNVPYPEETKLGAKDRWADLCAGRAHARCRILPRHDVPRGGRW